MTIAQQTDDPVLEELARLRARVAELESADAARRVAESALTESEAKYRSTMDASLAGIYVIQDLVFKYANPAMGAMFGYQVADLEDGMSPADLVVPELREVVRRNLSRRAEGEPGTPYEVTCVRKDKSVFHAMVWGKAALFHGRPASVGTMIDITELKQTQEKLLQQQRHLEEQVSERTAELRRTNARLELDIAGRIRAEAALTRSERRLRALINATEDDVVVLLDADMRVEIANERAAVGFERPISEMLGKRISDLMPATLAAARQAAARQVIASGRTLRFEDRRAGHWLDNNMCPVFGADGSPQAVAIFARDITARKAMEQALASAKDVAEKANLAKSRFLAAANHDLRQPLQALTLLLSALSMGHLDGNARGVVEDMQETLKIMEGLLNALLDISKLEAGILVPEMQNFHAVPFLQRMQNQFKAIARQKQVSIRIFPANAFLFSDPALLARVVQNFVSNAVRHTRGDRILIGCRRRGAYGRIEVWDQGLGIPEDRLDKIFEDFYQLGNPARNRHQGLGLGLAIAKRIAGLLDMRIHVNTRLGRGSVFAVEVPLGTRNEEQRPAPVAAGQGAITQPDLPILIVEDDEQVRKATSRLLQLWGYRTLSAANADEALALIERQPPCMALLDNRLPGGWNGMRLLERIRAELGQDLPGILLTGDTAAGPLRASRASGLPLLHKPIEPAELRRLIERHRRTE